ncbi:MAG: aldehyde dehydrogenase family protein [Vulcanimicrobiaceae bacterium]
MIPYAPALESSSDLALRDRYGLFIGGAWVGPTSAAFTAIDNPATEATLALVARANDTDVERAVRAARRAYDKYWRKLKVAERAKYLFRIARAVSDDARTLARIETVDGGAPIRHVRDAIDVASAAAFYNAGWADKLAWAIRGHERAHAIGVVGALVSSRSPLTCAIDIVAPALASGNTVVLKPAMATPLVTLALARICEDIDLPAGVLNVITGDAATGIALVEHVDCDLIALEGSLAVARSVRRGTATRRTRLHASVDGPACVIVYDDAPLEAAVEAVVAATYRSGTKRTASSTQVLVAESVASDVLAAIVARLATLRHGDPLDRNTDVGAFASRAHRDALDARIESARSAGATSIRAPWTTPDVGAFRAAEVLTDVPPTLDLRSDDATGPLVALATFRTADEAVARANLAGGATSVWTVSGALALYTAQRLRAGVVSCNTFDRFDPSSPFASLGTADCDRVGGLDGLRAYLDP